MKYDILIIGAGIVGLATALKILEKKPGVKLVVLEKESAIALHQTGNNSGVIHAGVYYKPGSLKSLNCRKGYQMLLDFCDKEDIRYELCGKLIIATTPQELASLDILHQRAIANGLTKVKKIGPSRIYELEPHAHGIAALHVPYTGIVDYREVSRKYAEIITTRYNGVIETGVKVMGFAGINGSMVVRTTRGAYQAEIVVNTAGLYSDKVAEFSGVKIDTRIIPFRGEYMVLKPEKRHLVRNLIYPVPDPNFPFLGVHFTRMIHGGIEAGPNAVWAFKREGYKKTSFDIKEFSESLAWPGFRKVMMKYWKMGLGEYYRPYNKAALVKALQRLVPAIQKEDLVEGGAGVRAQACDRRGGLVDDFLIVEGARTFHVLNAPSPAATSSLAIGDTLADKIITKL
jgi:(S)-2-hydroxyglutarate dehydrogenase